MQYDYFNIFAITSKNDFSFRYAALMNKSQFNIFWSFVVSSVSIGAIIGSILTRYVFYNCSDPSKNSLILFNLVVKRFFVE